MKIEDEKERDMRLTIYNYEKSLTVNPTDFITGIVLSQKKNELETYLQSKQLKLQQAELDKQKKDLGDVKDTVNFIQEQNNFIADRLSFNEKMNILARNYIAMRKAHSFKCGMDSTVLK